MRTRGATPRGYLLAQLSGWSVYTALIGLAVFSNRTAGTGQTFAALTANVVVMVTLSHLLRGWWKRRAWLRRSLAGQVARLLGAAVVMGVVSQALVLLAVVFAVRLYTLQQTSVLVFILYAVQATGIFVGWQVLYVGFHAVQRSRRAEQERAQSLATARDAELKALRAQLNPHFLFNALNTVRGLISEDPPRAQEAVTRLSALLRYTLTASEHARVPLARELEVVGDYLQLEQRRFEERLRFELDVPAELRALEVPVMLLQGLVENAVKHGLARSAAGGTVQVTARREEATLCLTVTNPAPTRASQTESTGVGVSNTTERLRLLYGARARFELRRQEETMVATVRIPLS